MLKRTIPLLVLTCLSPQAPAQDEAAEPAPPRLGWFTWSRWDDLHRNASADFMQRIHTFDRFFGDERIEAEGRGSQLKLGLGPDFSRFDPFSVNNRVRLRLELPQLEHRIQLVIDNDVESEEPFRGGDTTLLRDTRESRPDAALRTDLFERHDFKLSGDGGVKTGSSWQPFAKLRGRYIRHGDRADLRLTQSLEYYSEDHFRDFSEVQVARAFGDGWIISQSARVSHREKVSGYVPGVSSQIFKDHGSRSASRLELSAAWPQTSPRNPEDRDWEVYQTRYTFRRLAHAPWLFVEYNAGVRFSDEHDYEPDPFAGVILEVVVGDLR